VPRGQAVSGINQTPPGGPEPRHLVTDNDLRFRVHQARWPRRLHYSVGMAITEDMTTAILARRIGLWGVFRLEYQAAMSGT
jgi:hypothetical protein